MKKKKRHEKVRLQITQLAPTGEGVGHVEHGAERRAVFVPRSAPGDELLVEADFSRRPARGVLHTVVEVSPARVEPPCEIATRCGGCDWMHVARDAQLTAHVAHVREALSGRTPDVVRAGTPLRYRTRARLHVRATGGRAILGFFAAESHEPVEATTCVVLHASLDGALPVVGALLQGASGEGEARLARGAFDARKPVLDLSWPRDLPAAVYARAEKLVADGALGGVRITCGESARPATIGDATPWIEGADGKPLELGPSGFAQASEDMNGKLARAVSEAVGRREHVLELYAGAGNFTVLLAKSAQKVVAVDTDAASCEASQRNLERRGLRATIQVADASQYELPKNADTLVLDPPRAGAAHVAQSLVNAKNIKRVVYVSCDTRTLARDLAILAPSYVIDRASVFEMFPHTSHCETLVALSRKKR